MFKISLLKNITGRITSTYCRNVSYEQGQRPEPKIREYFYYIDHEGMLFLDDAKMKNFTSCFKDRKFLQFFFNRLKLNDTNRYQADFPYLSICGRERNFIRCDDLPIVFSHVYTNQDNQERLSYAHAGDLLNEPFQPDKIFMSPETGRVYHPTNAKHGSIGLIRSKLAIEFSKYFEFDDNDSVTGHQLQQPVKFKWKEQLYDLDRDWVKKLNKF